jgi:hypothetical protein
VLSCACAACSIQIRRKPSLDQQVGSPARTARRQTHQSDVVFHATTLLRSGYLRQQERSRTPLPHKYGRPPGASPGPVWLEGQSGPEIRSPKAETRRKSESRNTKQALSAALASRWGGSKFGVWPSDFFRVSTFGFRIWVNLTAPCRSILPRLFV